MADVSIKGRSYHILRYPKCTDIHNKTNTTQKFYKSPEERKDNLVEDVNNVVPLLLGQDDLVGVLLVLLHLLGVKPRLKHLEQINRIKVNLTLWN